MNFPLLFRVSLLFLLILPRLSAETPSEAAEKYLRDQTVGDVPGVAVLVARGGKILFQGGYGFADLEKKTPITPETKFRIGQVSMQFTAAAILKLNAEGRLGIDDSLGKYFPYQPHAWSITLRQLLTHTSGLHNYPERSDFLTNVVKPTTSAKLLASMEGETPDFAPGTSFRYGDTGYFLLGEIVAKVSGQSLADYLRTTFFEPLGMKDTGTFVNATPPPGLATGYMMNEIPPKPAPDWDASWLGGAAALYSTVGDLMRWSEALHSGKVLDQASLTSMRTPNPLHPGIDGLNYGFGVVLSEVQRLPAVSHNGGLPGWTSHLLTLPEQKTTIVALANATPLPPGLELAALCREFAKHFLADDIAGLPPLAEKKPADPEAYRAFVGRYDYRIGLLTVTTENGRLYGHFNGQPKYELFPKGDDEFFWKAAEASVRFLRNEKGDVVAAEHLEAGNIVHAPRVPDDPVKLTPGQLDAYVGEYEHRAQDTVVVMTVTREDQQLFAELPGQPTLPIFPRSADTFEWRMSNASVQFVKGNDGRVIKGLLKQKDHTFEATKIK